MPQTIAAPRIGPAHRSIAERVTGVNWVEVGERMDRDGFAKLPALLTAEECVMLRDLYADDGHFRSRVNMARHRFGEGEYKYLTYPLPPTVQELRVALYLPLAEIANRWAESLRSEIRFPTDLDAYLEYCHGRRQPWLLPRQPAPRGKSGGVRAARHAGGDLPRRAVMTSPQPLSAPEWGLGAGVMR